MINRLGFNNRGVDHLVQRAAQRRFKGVLGINIGKNFDTPIDRAADDYLACLDKVYPHADYITVNISSPNTKDLRELQGEAALKGLLGALHARRGELAERHGKRVPLVVKVAPDLEDQQIPAIADVVANSGFDGLIATNTTVSRNAVAGQRFAEEAGGLSGAPLLNAANHVLAKFREALPDSIAVIGTGGIITGEDAAEKARLGADLVQFYTGFVYTGPDLIGDCVQAIRDNATE
jgi:dihydroorotate dehydrogenase